MTPPLPAATDLDVLELAAKLRVSVTRLHRLLRQQSAELTLTQLSTLGTISRDGPITLGDLAAFEQVAPPTITKVVGKLEELGLVTKRVDETDRRVWHAAITPTGRRHLEQVRNRRTASLTTRLSALDEDELARLAAALDVLERLSTEGRP